MTPPLGNGAPLGEKGPPLPHTTTTPQVKLPQGPPSAWTCSHAHPHLPHPTPGGEPRDPHKPFLSSFLLHLTTQMAWSQLTHPKFASDFLVIYRGSVPCNTGRGGLFVPELPSSGLIVRTTKLHLSHLMISFPPWVMKEQRPSDECGLPPPQTQVFVGDGRAPELLRCSSQVRAGNGRSLLPGLVPEAGSPAPLSPETPLLASVSGPGSCPPGPPARFPGVILCPPVSPDLCTHLYEPHLCPSPPPLLLFSPPHPASCLWVFPSPGRPLLYCQSLGKPLPKCHLRWEVGQFSLEQRKPPHHPTPRAAIYTLSVCFRTSFCYLLACLPAPLPP